MKYDVHLMYAVKIVVRDVEADSQEAAILAAVEVTDVSNSLRSREAEDQEAPHLGAIVDELGDEEYLNTKYHEGPGARMYLSDVNCAHLDEAAP